MIGGSQAVSEVVCIVLLLGVLACAVVRPRGWPEAVVALPAAVAVVLLGAVSVSQAWAEIEGLLPVVGFLAAILMLARLCADEGLFSAAGATVGRVWGGGSTSLLFGVFVLAALTTAVLSLDATVVLLTPVVFATAAQVGVRARPHVYACMHLANTGSLALPVSNLTNLLALTASGLTFTRFAGLMIVPWLAAIAVEYLVFRLFFRGDLGTRSTRPAPVPAQPWPRFTLVVVVLVLAGFLVTSLLGVNPAWAAAAGAAILATRAIIRRQTSIRSVVAAADPLFLVFVLALAVIVTGALNNGLEQGLSRLVPAGAGLLGLLGVAAIAAVAAHLLNNLPATLALLPIVASGGAGPVLAVLIGVNIGPNLTYVGSLATLLWRRVLRDHATEPSLAGFTRLGLISVPTTVIAATVGLWAVLNATGGWAR